MRLGSARWMIGKGDKVLSCAPADTTEIAWCLAVERAKRERDFAGLTEQQCAAELRARGYAPVRVTVRALSAPEAADAPGAPDMGF